MRLWGSRRRAPRSSAYFDLKEELERPSCPLCTLVRRDLSRHVISLSYEYVNDSGVRADLRAANGFCNRHGWQFLDETGDGQAIAIIYADLLAAPLGGLERAARHRGGIGRVMHRLWQSRLIGSQPRTRCPVCVYQAARTRTYVEVFVAALAEPAFLASLKTTGVLCLAHAAMLAVAAAVDDERALFAEIARRSAARLNVRFDPADSTLASAAIAIAVGDRQALVPTCMEVVLATPDPRPCQPVPADHACSVAARCRCSVCSAAIDAADAEWPQSESDAHAALPLCNDHAWRLFDQQIADADRGQRLAAVMLASICLRARLDSVKRAQVGRRGGAPGGDCIACAAQHRREAQETGALAKEVNEGATIAPLCFRHGAAVLNALHTSAQRRAYAAATADTVRELRADLHIFIRKQDYRFRGEPAGQERDAPARALAWMHGPPGFVSTCTR